MEDRITPTLYLETSDHSTDEWMNRRADDLASTPGATRITCWRNCNPGRDDLPREIDDFETLGIVEADLSYDPAPAPDGISGWLFHRTPRPGQGILSHRPTVGLELVLVSPQQPEQAQKFRDWADFIHIRDIAAANVPHFSMITPYENARSERPRFMHFYEMDTREAEPAFMEMTPHTLRNQKAYGAHPTREWAGHPTLRIEYVNTFSLVSERDVSS